ncbi:MAG: 5-dehydro-4-deoxy-D-glucuronate isomerase [bacterium]|nr:5-dehydro-4-deoxy-D-glucuronate isomerase [candidate division KSB1 bacterium]MDH7558647.1 5-dehydro-4-deoxy-D-glucuronate isomerase [bacterium]
MEIRYPADPIRFRRMTTEETRDSFLVDTLFVPEEVVLLYSEVDRAVIGSAVPVTRPLRLGASKELAASYFCERREVGVLNAGETGMVTVDGEIYELHNKDMLYIGQGARDVSFESERPEDPAAFYLLSFPAHAALPTRKMAMEEAEAVYLGQAATCNERTIYKYIHPGGIKSCQLVMGVTVLAQGSNWNTMPPHTHERRTEIYLYFDMAEETRVFHFMGEPEETRHIVVANRQAVISPSWSIHAGVGTGPYSFCWAMGGENQAFEDMDAVEMARLR